MKNEIYFFHLHSSSGTNTAEVCSTTARVGSGGYEELPPGRGQGCGSETECETRDDGVQQSENRGPSVLFAQD